MKERREGGGEGKEGEGEEGERGKKHTLSQRAPEFHKSLKGEDLGDWRAKQSTSKICILQISHKFFNL